MKNSTMTQEKKDLLLKDLCARFPYEVKVNVDTQGDFTLIGLTKKSAFTNSGIEGCYNAFSIESIKPYLFPLSSMTEEQYNEMQTISGKDCLEHMEVEKEWRNNSSFSHLPLYEYRVIDFFIKNHFDYRGLIPMGLAIDATNLNIY